MLCDDIARCEHLRCSQQGQIKNQILIPQLAHKMGHLVKVNAEVVHVLTFDTAVGETLGNTDLA